MLHVGNLKLPRLDLLLELLDLVVEHKLELLQLLVLLLEVVDALLLVPDGLVALPDLFLEARDLLLEHRDLVVELLLPRHELLVVVLAVLNLLELRVELLAHDAVLPLEAQVLLPLRRELDLVLVLELLDLLVRVLLHLPPRLLQLPQQVVLLVPHPLQGQLLLLQLVLVLVRQLLHQALVRLDEERVLLIPPLVEELFLLEQLLVPLHFGHDLVLVLRLHLLRGEEVPLLHVLDPLLVLHLHVILLGQERLVSRLLRLDLSRELVCQLLDLVLVVHVLEAQLVVVVQLQLVHLELEVRRQRRLLLEVRLGDQDFLAERQQLLVAFGGPDFFVPHVEHEQHPVLPHGEEVRVVVGHAHARHRARVALVVLHLVGEGELPRLDAPRVGRGEEHAPRVRQDHLAEHRTRQVVLLDDVGVCDLLDLLVGPDGEGRLAVGGAHGACVVAALEHALTHALKVLEVPFVDGTVHPARHDLGVVGRPANAPHLAVVPPQVAQVLACVGRKHVDGVAVDGREHVPSVGELALAARLDGKLLEGPHVVHDHVEEAHLVAEAHEQVKARRVEGERVGLLVEVLCQLEGLVDVVPHAHALVKAARRHEGLTHARVDSSDLPRVKRCREKVKVCLVRLHDVRIGEVELVQLIVVRRHHQLLLGVRDGEVTDLDGVVVDAEHLGALVQLLLVRLVVDGDAPVVAPRHDPLREAHDCLDRVGVGGGPGDEGLELQGVDHQEVPCIGPHDHPLLRQPRVAQIVLGLALVQRVGELLQIGVDELELLENPVARHADEVVVRGAKGALVNCRVG
mmetsp:Transcript_21298/g.53663  ORF Transcript_21298/g.53663 Transcript_21298/m.53663 type:complete len:797 (-) Transcript_21298:529-2919(-)